MNTSFRIPRGAIPRLSVNVSIQLDCSVARGRRLFVILMNRVSMNVDKDWRVLSSPYTSVCEHLKKGLWMTFQEPHLLV